MPEDKLPIPQFAAKIKAKYPQYKDVNDTILVQKIVAKYPEYESQVDLSGIVKKKDFSSGGVENTTASNGLSGGRLGGSAKPVTAKDKLDFLGINDITFDAPQEQKPVVGIEQPQQKFGELPKSALGFAGEKKKPTYIDVNNPDHLAYLSERIGIEKENADPTKYGLFMSDEQKAKYRPKDAVNKMAEADELMQDVSQQASKNAFDKTISEVHPTMIGRKDLQKAGLEFLRQTDPAQYKRAMTIIESGEELGDEFSYNIEKTGGGILKNNLQYVTGDEGALNNIDELVELTDKAHPEIALAKGWDIIGAYNHKKDNSATGGWWRTKPTIGQVKKWIESPELLEMFTGNEAALEQIKGKLSEMPESFNSYKLDEIPVGGMFNNFGRAILGSAESVGNIFRGDVKRQQSNLNPTLGRGTLTGNYRDPGESPALLQQLYSLEAEEKDGTITETGKQQLKALRNSTKVRDGWDKFADGTGNLSGQVVAQALLMKGAGLGTGTIRGLSTLSNATRNTVNASIGTALNSYDQTRQQAVYNFPDDKVKQGVYTGIMTLANVASERIFKDEKVLDALKRELKGDLVNYVKNLSAQNINKAAIKKLVIEKLLKYGGQVLKESNKEAFEEGVVQAVDEAMQSTMGAEGYDGDKALQRIGDTYATTMLYGGIVSGLAAKSNMAADKFNRVQIYKMATNPATYQKEIQRQFEAGEITNAEKSEKLDLLYKAAEIAAAEPPKVAALPTKKKAEYLTQQLNIAVNEGLLEGAKDPNLQSELKTNIEESQKRAKAIYESEPEVLEEITKPKPTEDDTLLEKIKSSERVNGSEQSADLDYFIGKVGEAPIASQRYGEGVVEQLLPRVPTEKLQENYDFIVKVDPESAEADAIAKELDRREQQDNPPIDQVREMADENTPDEVVSESVAGSGGVGGDVELENGNKIQWNVYGNEESGEWTVGEKTKTRGGRDAVVLSKVYVEASSDGKSYTKEYADANGIKYDNERTVKHIVPLEDLQSLKETTKAETPTPKGNTSNGGVEAGSVGVGGDVMKGVNDKMRQTKLEMEFKDGDALSFKNEDTEIVIGKPLGADGKYSVTISEKSDSNTGLTINEGKTKLFDTKLEALDYAKELKEQSLSTPKAEVVDNTTSKGNTSNVVEAGSVGVGVGVPKEVTISDGTTFSVLEEKTVDIKDIKIVGENYDVKRLLNNPDKLEGTVLPSAKQLYEKMKKGEFVEDAVPILISPSGNLLDGNNRIHAYLANGVDKVKVLVVKPKETTKAQTPSPKEGEQAQSSKVGRGVAGSVGVGGDVGNDVFEYRNKKSPLNGQQYEVADVSDKGTVTLKPIGGKTSKEIKLSKSVFDKASKDGYYKKVTTDASVSEFTHYTKKENVSSISEKGFIPSETGELGKGVYVTNISRDKMDKVYKDSEGISIKVKGKLLHIDDNVNLPLSIYQKMFGDKNGLEYYNSLSTENKVSRNFLADKVKEQGYVGIELSKGVSNKNTVIFDPKAIEQSLSKQESGGKAPVTKPEGKSDIVVDKASNVGEDQQKAETKRVEKVAELEAERDMAILREKVPEMGNVNEVVPTREAVSAGSSADNLTVNKRKRAELKNRYTELQKLLGCLMK